MSVTPTPSRGIDSRIISAENEEKALTALHRFGWLPMRQIPAACGFSLQTARRTMARLLEKKEVQVKGPALVKDGSRVFALATAGVNRVRSELGRDAVLDKEFMRRKEPNYLHRCLANDFVLWWSAAQGSTGAWTEHEVATKRAPVSKAPVARSTRPNKIPDAMVAAAPTDDNSPWGRWLGWVEVEGVYKSKSKQEHMVKALCDILAYEKTRWEIGTDSVLKFAVVVCPRIQHERRLVRDLAAFMHANPGTYDAAYIKANLFVWRPDGSMQEVGELLPSPAKPPLTKQERKEKANMDAWDKANAEHTRLRAEAAAYARAT